MSIPPLRLLHVEDDDGDARAVKRALNGEFGGSICALCRVATLADALRELKASSFDAVLLDLNLADSRGLGNIRAIKEANPDLPIVVMSGHDDVELALDAVRQGAQEYMVKNHSSSRMIRLAVLSSIERKAHERALFRQANYDHLTGLPNRRMFLEYMQHWLLRADRWNRAEAILFFDVNGFKKINDTLGHDAGDAVLKQISQRLRDNLRASDMLARYAGDEFVLHLDTEAHLSRESCVETATKLAELFHAPIRFDGRSVSTSLSIGIALFPAHGHDIATLIQSADRAMYEAKTLKKDFCFA